MRLCLENVEQADRDIGGDPPEADLRISDLLQAVIDTVIEHGAPVEATVRLHPGPSPWGHALAGAGPRIGDGSGDEQDR